MKSWSTIAAIVAATASVMVYMHTTFALATDFAELKEIIVADGIQSRMWRHCETPNNELKRRIENERTKFKAEFDYAVDWPCTPR